MFLCELGKGRVLSCFSFGSSREQMVAAAGLYGHWDFCPDLSVLMNMKLSRKSPLGQGEFGQGL